ncbi:MAG: ComEC/Rec2 family competence protein [Kiritimatiellae bacterium]|nr:ComEC/Rec2 family competence protein [Kiritimatiellia bacterium]
MPEKRWLLVAATVAAGELAASCASNFAEAWPAVAVAATLVALFGYGAAVRGWHFAFLFLAGAALFLHASVERERCFQLNPWLRARSERRARSLRPASARVARARAELARRLSIGLDRDCGASALNRAILLGERGRLPQGQRRAFAASGAMHVFAVSGLHVTAVAGMLALLLRLAFVPRRLAGAAAMPAVWGYVWLIGAPPSAVRAALMASVCLLGPIFWRRPNLTAAWAVTLLAVCAVDPLMIADVGCLLSFTVMLALILAGACLRSGDGAIKAGVWMTSSAWLAGVPITARVFGHVTPGGLLANLALIPAAVVTVSSGVVGVLTGVLSDRLAAHVNNLAALSAEAMAGVAAAVARLPGADFAVRPWPLSACALWYGGLFLAFLLLAERRRRRVL